MSEILRYQVLTGQDPVLVRLALVEAGFRADTEPAPNSDLVTIDYDGDGELDREVARSVIAGVRTTDLEGEQPQVDPEPVQFTDEM